MLLPEQRTRFNLIKRQPIRRSKGLKRGGKLRPVNPERRAKRRARYKDYLHSPAWKRLRERVLERDGHACTRCHSTRRLECHHRSYQRFGHEDLDDLQTLCHDCHMAVEAELRPWNRGRS